MRRNNIRTKKIVSALVTSSLIFFLSSCSTTEDVFVDKVNVPKVFRVALLPLENLSKTYGASEIVAKIFSSRLSKTGRFFVINSGDIRELLIKDGVEDVGEVDFETLLSMREVLKADAVITGRVTEYSEGKNGVCSLTFRMVETSTGKIVWSASDLRYFRAPNSLITSFAKRSVYSLAVTSIDKMISPMVKAKAPKKIKASGNGEESEDIRLKLARLSYTRGDYRKAVPHLLYASKNDPDNRDIWTYKLGISYEKTGEWKQALDVWLEYGKSSGKKKDAETFYRIGHAYRETEDYEKAIEALSAEAIGFDKSWEDKALFETAGIYSDREEFDKALEIYEKFILPGEDPAYLPEAFLQKGKIQYRMSDYDAALETLGHVVKAFPETKVGAEADFYLGKIYLERDEFRNAIQVLYRAAALFPEGALKEETAALLIEAFFKAGDDRSAAAYLSRIDWDSFSGDGKDRLREIRGEIFYKNREYNRALEDFMEVLGRGAAKDDLWFKAAKCYQELGKIEEALDILKRFSEYPDGPYFFESIYQMGILYQQTGYIKRAIEFFDKLASTENPFTWKAKMDLGEIYMDIRDYRNALEIYNDIQKAAVDPEIVQQAQNKIKTIQYKRTSSIRRSR